MTPENQNLYILLYFKYSINLITGNYKFKSADTHLKYNK